MQIESILIFIAFIVISSMANKRKQAQQQQRQQRKPLENQLPSANAGGPQAKQPSRAPSPRPVKKSLQDLFREMQQELEAEFKRASEPTPEERSLEMKDPSVGTEPVRPTTTTPKKSTASKRAPGKMAEPSEAMKRKSPIYGNEIKEKPHQAAIELTEEALLNGIIFSEVLGKPKSLRR